MLIAAGGPLMRRVLDDRGGRGGCILARLRLDGVAVGGFDDAEFPAYKIQIVSRTVPPSATAREAARRLLVVPSVQGGHDDSPTPTVLPCRRYYRPHTL